jgi:hypothetical protein
MTMEEFRGYINGAIDTGEINDFLGQEILELVENMVGNARSKCAAVVQQTPLVVGKRHIYAQEAISLATQRLLDGVQPEEGK